MPPVKEEIFFFEGSAKRRLLGFLHSPLSSNRNTGIVYCHPFAEEKNMSHAVVVQTSRALAQNGFTVFRFDMSGCGDSEGELDEVTIADWEKDLALAVKFLQKETTITNLGLWGLRTGCGLSLLHAAQNTDVSFMILWQPVVDFRTYINRFLRWKISSSIVSDNDDRAYVSVSASVKTLSEEGIVNVIGYPITQMCYDSFYRVDKRPFEVIFTCPTLLLSISPMESLGFSIKRYLDSLNVRGTPTRFFHVMAEPFWDRYWRWDCREVTDVTRKWLREMF